MKRLLFKLALLFPVLAATLEVQPWFGCVYELHLLADYSYSHFDKVQGGVPALTKPFTVNLGYLGLDVTLSPQWAIDIDAQLAESSEQIFNFRTAAAQARYLWLDDLVGDGLTLSTGFNFRGTPSYALRDISCPSRTNVDFEVNTSVGKEFEANPQWLFRIWGYGAIGQGIKGSPWVRAIAAIETNLFETHKLGVFAEGVNGFGRHTHLSTKHFNGYSRVRYKAIDLSFRYGLRLGVWGTLRAEYTQRFLAKAYPQDLYTWSVSYLLPFSF